MKMKLSKVVSIIAITLVALVVVAIGGLYLFFPKEKIKSIAISEASKALGRDVKIDKVGFSLFPFFGITINGLEVDGTKRTGFSQQPMLKMDLIQVQVAVMSLLHKTPEITKIILNKPQILVEVDTAGHFSFDDMAIMKADTTKKVAKSSSPLALPVPITLKIFSIKNGVIIYRDLKASQEFAINNLNQTVSFSIDKELKDIKTKGTLVLGDVSVKTKEIVKPLKNLTITLSHDVNADLVNGTANVNQLRLSFQKLYFNLKGSVKGLNTVPELDLALDSDPIEISDLLKEIPVELAPDVAKLTASGVMNLSLFVKGQLKDSSALPINGTCKLDNVNVKYAALPKSVNNLFADCNFSDTSVSINSMKFNLGDNPVELHASFINFKNPYVDLGILAKLKLGDFRDIFELPKGAELSGLASLDINAKGRPDPSDPSKLDLKGIVDFADLSVLWPPLVKPAVINGRVTLSSVAIGQNLAVGIGASSLTLSGNVKNYLTIVFPDKEKKLPRPYAEFSLVSPLLNVDEFMPPSKDTAVKTSTPGSADVPLIAPLPGVDLKGSIKSTKCIYQGIQLDNLSMLINVINDIADINIRTGFAGGTITNALNGDLRDVNNVKFTNSFGVDKVQVGDLITKFAPFVKPVTVLNKEVVNLQNSLSGRLSLQSKLSGSGGTQNAIMKTLVGDVTLGVADGTITKSAMVNSIASNVNKFVDIKDITFREMHALIHIENEMLNFENFKIGSSVGDWDIKGATGFNGNLELGVNNKLTKDISDKVNALQNKGKSALKNVLSGTALAAASSLVDNVGIPSDREGRITLKLNLGGTISDPKASFVGFGEGEAKSADVAPTPKQQVQQKVEQVISEKKEEIKQAIDEQKIRAEEAAKQKLDEEKAALEAQTKQQQEQLKNDALKKLKKLF